MREKQIRKEDILHTIEITSKRIDQHIESLSKTNDRSDIAVDMLGTIIHYFNVVFASGEEREALETVYKLMLMPLKYIEEDCEDVTYKQILDILSIGVLLDKNPMNEIKHLLDVHVDDFLGLFTEYFTKEPLFGIDKDIEFQYMLVYLNIALTESKEESLQIIKDYLENDFKRDNNLCHWSFEAMALAKMYDVDVTTLLEHRDFDVI